MSKRKHLYIVELSQRIVVLAESEASAMNIATMESHGLDWAECCDVDAYDHLPSGWDPGCLPYGDHEDLTVEEWIKRDRISVIEYG